jgi:hypothetical protein
MSSCTPGPLFVAGSRNFTVGVSSTLGSAASDDGAEAETGSSDAAGAGADSVGGVSTEADSDETA